MLVTFSCDVSASNFILQENSLNLEIGSNDIIRSTVHRVRAPHNFVASDTEGMIPARYSIPYVREGFLFLFYQTY